MKWKYESRDSAQYIYLHDCECEKIYNRKNDIIMNMNWMEILENHPDNPYNEPHQSGIGIIELLDCKIVKCEHTKGDKTTSISNLKDIEFDEFEILDFDIKENKETLQAYIYMLKTKPQKEYEDISIIIDFKHSITKFNKLNNVSWFFEFNKN